MPLGSDVYSGNIGSVRVDWSVKGALWVSDAYAKDKTFKRMKAAASAARLGDIVVTIRFV
jgi:hypothetical protein